MTDAVPSTGWVLQEAPRAAAAASAAASALHGKVDGQHFVCPRPNPLNVGVVWSWYCCCKLLVAACRWVCCQPDMVLVACLWRPGGVDCVHRHMSKPLWWC